MILSFGLCAMVVIAGFAIYRFATGHVLGGMVNSTIVVGVALVLIYSWRTDDSDRAGRFFAVVATVACISSATLFGHTGILWGYVVLWVNFMLADRRFALAMNFVLITVMLFMADLFTSRLEMLTYAMTAILVTAYGFIFAQRFSRQQQQLEEMASRDPLTRAGNRRLMRRGLTDAEVARRTAGISQTLVVMDLDGFKQVNDTHGHEAGDRVLRDFADLIRANIRKGDGFYRYGGEEFTWLISDLDADAAEQAVNKLHAAVSGTLKHPTGPIRFSAGVAVLEADEQWPAWLARADAAMYRAKQRGGDCVVMSPPAGRAVPSAR